MSERGGRQWSLEGARAVLPDVRARTERAVRAADSLAAQRDAAPEGSSDRKTFEERLESVLMRWAREMEALGADVKGVWLVDFDNGNGYYCWRWPEEAIDFYHGYEDGFDGRVRIQ
jgi:hypothetical protein